MRIKYKLLDAHDNVIEMKKASIEDAARAIADFVTLQGGDPDGHGAGATEGSVQFEPVYDRVFVRLLTDDLRGVLFGPVDAWYAKGKAIFVRIGAQNIDVAYWSEDNQKWRLLPTHVNGSSDSLVPELVRWVGLTLAEASAIGFGFKSVDTIPAEEEE